MDWIHCFNRPKPLPKQLIWIPLMLELCFTFYNQKDNKKSWGITPNKNPITNSLGVCAFISSLDEATKPFIITRKAIIFKFWIWLWMLRPITKTVKALIATIWRLAFVLKNNKINAIIVLSNPAKKKKYSSGKRSMVMLFRINKRVKKHKITNGILRCDISEIIIESTFPAIRSAKKKRMGSSIVIITIWKRAKYFSGFV